jgi:excisionase family DNA binding protein
VFTVKQIAEEWQVSEGSVLGWIHSGQLRAVNVGDRRKSWRVSPEALQSFEHDRTHRVTPHVKPRRRAPSIF